MTQNTEVSSRIEFLDIARGIAIIMVIGVHVMAYSNGVTEELLWLNYLFGGIAVPVFFIVDGYLVFRAREKILTESYYNYIKKSFLRLVVPWFIFSIIYISIRYILEVSGLTSGAYFHGQSIKDFILHTYASVHAVQLYFLLSLFIIRLITPIVLRIIRSVDVNVLLLLFFIYLLFYTLVKDSLQSFFYIQGGQDPVLHAIWGMQFTIAGYLIYIYQGRVKKLAAFYVLSSIFITVILLGMYKDINTSVALQYSYLFWFMSACCLFEKYLLYFKSVGKHTMSIYLVHAPLIVTSATLIVSKLPLGAFNSITAGVFITFFCSIAVSKVLNRLTVGRFMLGDFSKVSS
ncbi:MAG: acyltransferase [Saccharospirillum sp.]|nr:acyltransferase [Saccharospirillum sp.]